MTSRSAVAVAIILAASTRSSVVRAQRALTPGAVVLLANQPQADASETLRAALTDQDPDVRRAAARVASVAHPEVTASLLRALEAERDPHVAAEMVKDAVALGGKSSLRIVEPAAARAGLPAVMEIAEWFARMDSAEFIRRLSAWRALPGSDAAVARIIALAVKRHPESADDIRRAWNHTPTREEKQLMKRAEVFIRTPLDLAGEFLQSTLTAARCDPANTDVGVASITYTPDGRPKGISLDPGGLSAQCRDALLALARISTDAGDSIRDMQTVAVPMFPEFLACSRSVPAAASAATGIKAAPDVTSPRLKKDVKPSYTAAAMRKQTEGVVELTAVVSPTGCVASASVVKSLKGLNLQGILAVVQWRFEPGRFEGTPVPVRVDIELTFTLK